MTQKRFSLNSLPLWMRSVLLALLAYQVVIYGVWMRVRLHISAVGLPWLMNQPGYALYDNILIGYTPGYLWMNKLFVALVPDHVLRLRGIMIILTEIMLLAVFWLAWRWWGQRAALTATLFYALWGPVIMDQPGRFEVWIGLVTLLAVALWHKPHTSRRRIFAAGLLVGLAVTFKNQAVLIPAGFILWRVLTPDWRRWRVMLIDLVTFGVGAAILPGLTGVILIASGRLSQAWILATGVLGEYRDTQSRMPGISEWGLLALWLLFVFVYYLITVRERDRWGRELTLLALLLPPLMLPVYPRYGRAYLSASIPFVALMSGFAFHYLLKLLTDRSQVARYAILGVTAGSLLIGLVLPTYYRLKLGPRNGEVENHIPLAAAMQDMVDHPDGLHIWMLPDIDPTSNFFAVSGYLPAPAWMQSYWLDSLPTMRERYMGALAAAPPAYALVVDKWQDQIAPSQLEYLTAHYMPETSFTLDNDFGHVTVYSLITP